MSPFTIWNENKLTGLRDVRNAFDELMEPLISTFSPGGARPRLSESGSTCSEAAAEFEGYSRPLWGIVPYQYGGGNFGHWELYRRGLVNGTNPHHEEFWGYPNDYDQLLVDIAAIGFALCFVPEHVWEPLNDSEKKAVENYLLKTRSKTYCHNNWKFFRVIVDLGLDRVGVKYDKKGTTDYLVDLDSFYLGDGWYGDGKPHRIDNYNAMAFHFYGLIYTIVRKEEDPERCSKYLERATLFAQQYIHWFDDNGACLPYGRSLIYRFATSGFWGLFPLALDSQKEPPIPWGVMKCLYLKSLQWWSKQPMNIFGSKLLSLGYAYPNGYIMERYNSPQSPYWSFKGFSALMISEDHPFWQSKAVELNDYFTQNDTKLLSVTGMSVGHFPGNTIALINGPWHDEYQNEKYTKFAYSTRFGFGVVSNSRTFQLAHLDNSLGFSFNNQDFFVRQDYSAFVSGGYLKSEWSPTKGITVESWIIPRNSYHIRIHYIENQSKCEVYTREGGFAISVNKKKLVKQIAEDNVATASTEVDISEIVDLADNREALVCTPEPNTNMLSSKVLLPELVGRIGPKSKVKFACLVFGQSAEFQRPEKKVNLPSDAELTKLSQEAGRVCCNGAVWN
ncbi:hypothetical protein JA9_000002 [Meyerozyma sp. JA9]|nr:hypothetical protein JA9_000002 [Meyerozyma sp. JA9]